MTRLAAARLVGTGSGLPARLPAAKPPVPEDETGVIGTEPDEAAGVPEDSGKDKNHSAGQGDSAPAPAHTY